MGLAGLGRVRHTASAVGAGAAGSKHAQHERDASMESPAEAAAGQVANPKRSL